MTPDTSGTQLAAIITRARPGHPLRKWLVLAALIAIAAASYVYLRQHETRDTGPVFSTETLKRGDLAMVVTATGNLAPTNQVTIGSELSGIIMEVFVMANDHVTKGQQLARLDPTKLSQQTERSRAMLASAKAKVGQAQATVRESMASRARLEELHRISGGKTPSQSELEAATAKSDRAAADLRSALAAVDENGATVRANESDLEKAVIRSPVDGIVLTRTVEVGQTVAASFTAPVLFLVAEDLRQMKLMVTVAEADIGRLADGQAASFAVDAWPTRTYSALVKRVAYGSVITNNVVTYSTELAVANDDLSLRPGMTATADIAVAKSDHVLLVPNTALRFDPAGVELLGKAPEQKRTLVQSLSPGGGRRWGQQNATPPVFPPRAKGSRVWTLHDDKPVEVPVQIGITDGRFTEALGEGLSEGMPIIISALPAADS